MKRLAAIAAIIVVGTISLAQAAEKLMVYTSMKESLIGKIRDEFKKKHPEVAFDFYSAGADRETARARATDVERKIAAERQAGKMTVDVLWHSEVPDFYQLKKEGMLESYVSPESKEIRSPVKDPDGFFTPARLGTLGIAYNTKKVTNPPRSWQDLLDARFKNGSSGRSHGGGRLGLRFSGGTRGQGNHRGWQQGQGGEFGCD